MKTMKKIIGNLIAVIVLIMLALSSVLVVLRLDERPRTDDAFLYADTANIAPEVSGRIVSLNIRNNQSVHVGDVLFVIDPEQYQLKLNATQAQFRLATTTLARMEPLLSKGYVTAEQIDEACASKESAQANEALSKRDFNNTTVHAPFDGKIVGLNNAVGEYISTGQSLFTMIDISKWYVIANFRETEIAKMEVGAAATVYVMAQPKQALKGRVESLGWGVTNEDATLDHGLPTIPTTLNWVRLAQRFPVRILLDHPPENLMRMGATAVVVVQYDRPLKKRWALGVRKWFPYL
jgi:multidrug efflux system membrane fusion protein